jgi:hypothetical protein
LGFGGCRSKRGSLFLLGQIFHYYPEDLFVLLSDLPLFCLDQMILRVPCPKLGDSFIFFDVFSFFDDMDDDVITLSDLLLQDLAK